MTVEQTHTKQDVDPLDSGASTPTEHSRSRKNPLLRCPPARVSSVDTSDGQDDARHASGCGLRRHPRRFAQRTRYAALIHAGTFKVGVGVLAINCILMIKGCSPWSFNSRVHVCSQVKSAR